MKALIAMSGGVDSSVAALLTKQKMNHMDSFDEIAIYVVNNR